MSFVGRTYLQTREPHPLDVAAVGVIHGKTVPIVPPREVVAVGGTWGKNIAVRWPCGRVVVRPSRGLKKTTNNEVSMNDQQLADRVALTRFAQESNHIEGIARVADYEIDAHADFLELTQVTVDCLAEFVGTVAGAELRDQPGMNVRVGEHVPLKGGPSVRVALTALLERIDAGELTPYKAHVAYETLHPFTDGNGRSGRALWAWQMRRDGLDPFSLPFLHRFYYQSLDGAR